MQFCERQKRTVGDKSLIGYIIEIYATTSTSTRSS